MISTRRLIPAALLIASPPHGGMGGGAKPIAGADMISKSKSENPQISRLRVASGFGFLRFVLRDAAVAQG
ncbi:MAG: hypothetical protein WEB53_06485 [Akkermansiaceae bacterium]